MTQSIDACYDTLEVDHSNVILANGKQKIAWQDSVSNAPTFLLASLNYQSELLPLLVPKKNVN